MKKTTKATLFSLLIFPGTGHFLLRRWGRGLLFLVPALCTSIVLANSAIDRASDAADRLMSGEVPLDEESIRQLLDEELPPRQAMLISTAEYLLLACWIVGAVDAYVQARETGQPRQE